MTHSGFTIWFTGMSGSCALSGEVGHFAGISDPYEPPLKPCVVVHSERESVTERMDQIWRELERRGFIRNA